MKISYLVCALASEPAIFDDDVFTDCCECGARLRHRPHVPKKAKPICQECVMPHLREDDCKLSVTDKTVKEIMDLVRKSRS